MRLSIITVFSVLPLSAEPSRPSVSLIPQREMGVRAVVGFKEIIWRTDCEWFTKPAPVCKVTNKLMDVSKIHEQAQLAGMSPVWNKAAEEQFGSRSEGAFYYLGPQVNHFCKVASGSPKIGRFHFCIAPYDRFERDKDEDPILKPLPSKEQAVAISQEWMKKLGIDEELLYRHGSGPDGFDVLFRIDLESGFSPKTKKIQGFDYGMTLNFSQQIGGLSTFWTHDGGTLECQIADGGEFSTMRGSLTAWEKIGDYPVLGRAEIEKALREGFAWSVEPLDCDTLTISRISLEAFHFRPQSPQKDFPLIYRLDCSAQGGQSNGQTATIYMPALKQQRDKYGPLPAKPLDGPPPGSKPMVPPFLKTPQK